VNGNGDVAIVLGCAPTVLLQLVDEHPPMLNYLYYWDYLNYNSSGGCGGLI
jgi:hypothetical protein